MGNGNAQKGAEVSRSRTEDPKGVSRVGSLRRRRRRSARKDNIDGGSSWRRWIPKQPTDTFTQEKKGKGISRTSSSNGDRSSRIGADQAQIVAGNLRCCERR